MTRPSSIPSLPPAYQGFSLFEVLITVVVVSIGLLGLAGLQFAGLRATNNAQDATYASQLAQDVAERIWANQAGAANYNNVSITSATSITASCGAPAPALPCTSPTLMRHYDVAELHKRITTNDGNPPILSNGAIRITGNSTNFTIIVFWDNPGTTLPTACPTTGWKCMALATSIPSP